MPDIGFISNSGWRCPDGDPVERGKWDGGLCNFCDRPPTAEGHDPCIANLPGVEYACCGHGETGPLSGAYLVFRDKQTVIRGAFDHLAYAEKIMPCGDVIAAGPVFAERFRQHVADCRQCREAGGVAISVEWS